MPSFFSPSTLSGAESVEWRDISRQSADNAPLNCSGPDEVNAR
jgi:hypothetical protein